MFATIVTLAVVRGQLTSNSQKGDRMVVATLDRLVDQAATSPFGSILDESFVRPESESCANSRTSCPVLLNTELLVTWTITSGGDGDDAEETVDWVELVASAEWVGTTFTSTKRVTAPTPNWRLGWGVLQVNVDGPSYDGEIYLVDASTGKPAAGSSPVVNNVAWLSAPLEVCGPTSEGCVLALGPYGTLADRGVAIDAVSAMTEIELVQDKVTTTSVLLRPVTDAALTLLARNGAGETSTNPHLGSVCIWARFHDGLATRTVPFCNDLQPDQVIIDDYAPDSERPWLRLVVPASRPVKLYIDNPSGNCNLPTGTKRWNGSSWVDGGTCTGWTWGAPATIAPSENPNQTEAFIGSTIRLEPLPSRYELTWTTSGGVPAAGGDAFHALWANPRDADLGPSGTCPTNTPHCNSGASVAPVLTSPRTGSYQVSAVTTSSGAAITFTVSANDYDWDAGDGPTTITVNSLPAAGSLVRLDETVIEGVPTTIETTLSVNDIVASAAASDVSAQLRFYAPANSNQQQVVFGLSNSSGSRMVAVALAPQVRPWILRAEPTRIAQGGQATVNVLVIGTNGLPLSGANITPTSLPAGLSVAPATSNTDGWAQFQVSVTDTPAGNVTFLVQGDGGAQSSVNVNVIPRAGSITLSAQLPDPVVFDQGTTTQVEFRVDDLAGVPRSSAGVAVWATRAGGVRTTDVYATSRGCETDAQGNCTVTIAATNRAAAGAYTLNVSIEGVSATLNLQVDPKPYRANATLLTLAQASTSTLDVTVLDGAGDPVAGVVVNATASVAGLSFGSATTGQNGVATLPVSSSNQTPAGLHIVQLSGGGSSGTVPVKVTQSVARISVAEVSVNQGEAARTDIIAYDTTNLPVAGAVISAISDEGLVVRAAPTDRNGRSVVEVNVPYNVTPTRYLVSLSSGGQTVQFLPVRVLRGFGSVTTTGTITAGQTTEIALRLYDLNGSALGSRSVTVAPLNAAVKVSAVGGTPAANGTFTSGPDGVVTVAVTAATGTVGGASAIKISSGATSIIVYVRVVAQ